LRFGPPFETLKVQVGYAKLINIRAAKQWLLFYLAAYIADCEVGHIPAGDALDGSQTQILERDPLYRLLGQSPDLYGHSRVFTGHLQDVDIPEDR
jgi:hypothetical protein